MNIKQLLSDSLEERFKAGCVIKELEEMIREMAKEKTFKKYKNHKITRNELEFELFDVSTRFDILYLNDKKVTITLIYTVCSKLPKDKSDRLKRFKEHYRKMGWAEECNLKIPIWQEFIYEVELDNVLNDTINLTVE